MGPRRSGEKSTTSSEIDEQRTARLLEDVIDPNASIPLHVQVADGLVAAIESGEIPTGARLGNEAELSRRLNLSRPTFRRALGTLADRGLIVRRQGVGTVVLPTPVRRSIELTGLHDDLREAGRRPSTQVLELEQGPGPSAATAALGLAPGAELVFLKRLRLVDSEPLAVMSNHIPPELLEIDREGLEQDGLYRVMRRQGVVPRVAWQSVGARGASAEEAGLLGLETGAAVLTSRRISYDAAGKAVEFANHVFVAERYTFEMNLVAHAGGS